MLEQESDIPSSAGQMSPGPSILEEPQCFDETEEAKNLRRKLLSGFRKEINTLANNLDCTIISPAEIELNTQYFLEFKKSFNQHCNLMIFTAADEEYMAMIKNFLSDWSELKKMLIEVICKGEDAEKLCEFYREQVLDSKKFVKKALKNANKLSVFQEYCKRSKQVITNLDPQVLKIDDNQDPEHQIDHNKLKVGYQSLLRLSSFLRKDVKQALTDSHRKLTNETQYKVACDCIKRTVASFKLLLDSNAMRQGLIDMINETALKFKSIVENFEINYENAAAIYNKTQKDKNKPKPAKQPKKTKKLPRYPKLDLSNLESPSVSTLPASIKPSKRQSDAVSRKSKQISSSKYSKKSQIIESASGEEDDDDHITGEESETEVEVNDSQAQKEAEAAAILDNDDVDDDMFIHKRGRALDDESSPDEMDEDE